MAEINDFSIYKSIINKDNLNNSEFHKLKNLCNLIPVRKKGKMFQTHCMGLYSNAVRDKIVSEYYKISVFKRYTSEDNWFCTRINIYLALDAEVLPKYSEYIKELKCCIGWQEPKYKGTCYRGAKMSALEIFACQFKDTFYIPSFWSTSLNKNVATETFTGNVLFEIDISEFNNFTTIIQKNQSIYSKEEECLLSCYNVYKWIGYGYNDIDNYVTVRLKILDYGKLNDIQTHSIINPNNKKFPEKYLKSGSQTLKNRNVSAKELNNILKEIIK